VPISGDEIRRALARREDIEQLRKDEIRAVKHQMRWAWRTVLLVASAKAS